MPTDIETAAVNERTRKIIKKIDWLIYCGWFILIAVFTACTIIAIVMDTN